jgi:hypothetical protein
MLKNTVFACFIYLVLSGFSCAKHEETNNLCIKAKLLTEICGQAVFQILDSEHFHLGENGWEFNGSKIDHVFYTELGCEDLKIKLTSGSEVSLLIKSKREDRNCAICEAALLSRPKTTQFIKVVDRCS